MKVPYVLTATGNVAQPQINHCIFNLDETGAREEAAKVAPALYAAGYFNFTLFRVIDEENHILVTTIKVESREPIVTVR